MIKSELNILVEFVSDINFEFPYLEVFFKNSNVPFLDIGITSSHCLSFNFYKNNEEIILNLDELEFILKKAKDFLPNALKNEEDFRNFYNDLEDVNL